MSAVNNHISYIEFKTDDVQKSKLFYNTVFGWEFKDYGPDYASFKESGVFGGFEKSDEAIENGVLIVLYHEDLPKMKDLIVEAGGMISKDIFDFPGGHRFHFFDPSGNELGVWSDKYEG
jgi:predicted enzyme related to lactoylglutathione lyase